MLPTQEPALTTRDSRKNPWGVLAALSAEGTASGSLYVDDGESQVPNATLFVDVRPLFPFLSILRLCSFSSPDSIPI